MRRGVAGRLGERVERVVGGHPRRAHAQLGAELVRLDEVVLEHRGGLPGGGVEERVGGDERVAVAIAADPTADVQERRDGQRRAAVGEQILEIAHQARQLGEERAPMVVEAVVDLVDHRDPLRAQQPRAPHRENGAAQRLIGARRVRRREGRVIPFGEERGDLALAVEDALALHLGRVGGEHRGDMRRAQHRRHRVVVDAGAMQAAERRFDAAVRVAGARQQVGARQALHVLILGDVRKLGKERRRMHRKQAVVVAEAGEHHLEVTARLDLLLATEAHRRAPDRFDFPQRVVAGLLRDRLAEETAEKADVGAQAIRNSCSSTTASRVREPCPSSRRAPPTPLLMGIDQQRW